MVVDPGTDMPAENMGSPESAIGIYGSVVGQNYGIQNPLYYDAMNMIPGATTMVAWNMARTRNTILNNRTAGVKGRGILDRLRHPTTGSMKAGGVRQTFSPFRFGSLADLSNIDPEFFGSTRKGRNIPFMKGESRKYPGASPTPGPHRPGYTPFNILSKGGNWLTRQDWTPDRFKSPEGVRAFAPGMLGTLSTMASINAGSYSAERTAQVMGSINRFRAAGGTAFNPFESSMMRNLTGVERQSYMSSALASARFKDVRYAGQAAGYFQQAQAARMGTSAASGIGMGADSGYVGKGAATASRHLAGNGPRGAQILARTVGSRGAALGLRGVPYLGQALLVHDITKGIGTLAGRGVRLGIEGVKSAQGDLVKPGPMNMGYVDNSVAATSRQRGVMAISNSRLNARSFLGQEASYVHQNFG
jgi:hypothetical protein